MPHHGSAWALPGHHTLPSKFRPSDIDNASDDSQSISSRQGRGRRDSILGIRNLFSRSTKKEGDPVPFVRASRSSSIRASFSERNHWPYGPQARSDVLNSAQSLCDPAREGPDASHLLLPLHGALRRKPSIGSAWAAPPLSKAYSQAVMHGILPSPTLSADAILRNHDKKTPISAEASPLEDLVGDFQMSEIDRLRRRLRGDAMATHNLQWTAKIYVLVLSGHLLQYAGEGHHDRLPEKVLHLGPSSAAFASDLIPGRHWVLQVSSTTDNEGPCQAESRSLLSKLHLRIPDRRTTSNLLMVFEGAEDMKEWIAILRTQIEKSATGGDLAEFDKMARDPEATLVSRGYSFRHPFRKASGSGLQHRSASSSASEDVELEPRATMPSSAAPDADGAAQDSLVDDASTTTSIMSQDGHQLDALRENPHRFSHVSSGQRTVVTSTSSSPAASPVADRFSRHTDADGDAVPSRRPSLQSPLSEDGRHETTPDHVSSPPYRGDALSQLSPTGAASLRRRSYGGKLPTFPPAEGEGSFSGPNKVGLSLFPRPSLRKPLGSIRVSRPLSIVEDQPSPRDHALERPVTSHHAGSRPSTPPAVPLLPQGYFKHMSHAPSFDSSLSQGVGRSPSLMPGLKPCLAIAAEPRPRRLSSLGALRRQAETNATPRKEASRQPLAIRVRPSFPSQNRKGSTHVRNLSDEGSEAAQIYAALSRAAKRASIASISSNRSSSGELTFSLEIPPMPAPPPSKALPPIPLRPSTSARGKPARKMSMPAVEGPPPAPPPTCALPPIPRK